MQVRKAVITAAGRRQQALPVQTLVDRDGVEKSVLAILVEEALDAGVEEVAVVVAPGDEAPYARAAGEHAARLQFIVQERPLGYGHAVACARQFTAGAPFLHLVGDHLYVSAGPTGCARRLVTVAEAESCSVSAVQATREHLLPHYGAVGGRRVAGQRDLYTVETVIEKPTPTEAELRLVVPGLRAGHYLCFFGMHVLAPAVMELLGAEVARAEDQDGDARAGQASREAPRGGQGPGLSAALAALATRQKYLALEERARRFDVGVKYGLLSAQLALALAGDDREEVLGRLIECWRSASWPRSTLPRAAGCPAGRAVSGPGRLASIITAADPALRDRSIDERCRGAPAAHLLERPTDLERFRRQSDNLYERVRALFFLYAIHRFHLPRRLAPPAVAPRLDTPGLIPYDGYTHLLQRRFEEAIAVFLDAQAPPGAADALSSALAAAYHGLGFQTLADQVRRSVRSVRGNQWMFRIGHPADQPLRLRPELLRARAGRLCSRSCASPPRCAWT